MHCTDTFDRQCELRAYGSTPEEVAKDAWARFNENEEHWDIFGYPFDFIRVII